jgi:hypothetical protein
VVSSGRWRVKSIVSKSRSSHRAAQITQVVINQNFPLPLGDGIEDHRCCARRIAKTDAAANRGLARLNAAPSQLEG